MVDPDTGDVASIELSADGPPIEALAARRRRFRAAIADLSRRSTSNDLVRWMLVPGSVAVLLGFAAMALAWVGAARTAREIEQIPYLISGGLVGLALVVLGGLLLVSTFWVAVLRKLHEEADARAQAQLEQLQERLADLETSRPAAQPGKRAPRSPSGRRPAGAASANGSSTRGKLSRRSP